MGNGRGTPADTSGVGEVGYVLEEGTFNREGPFVFPGVPGVYHVGVPVAVYDTGLSEDEMAERVKTLAVPLKKVSNAEPTRKEGVQASGADIAPVAIPNPQAVEAAAAAEPEDLEKLSRPELDELAASLNLDVATLTKKADVVNAIKEAQS